jgi:hypothetical protein
MIDRDWVPEREMSEDGESVHIETEEGYTAEVLLCSPFGPSVVLRQALPEGASIVPVYRFGVSPIGLEHTLPAEGKGLYALWSVLTMAIAEVAPGYCAARLREIEGAEVARQES